MEVLNEEIPTLQDAVVSTWKHSTLQEVLV